MKKWSSPLFLFRRTFTLMVVITSIIAVLYLAALYSGATTTTTTRPMAVNRIHVLSAACARHSTRPLAAVGTLAKLVHP